jgi:hypothetical protein
MVELSVTRSGDLTPGTSHRHRITRWRQFISPTSTKNPQSWRVCSRLFAFCCVKILVEQNEPGSAKCLILLVGGTGIEPVTPPV